MREIIISGVSRAFDRLRPTPDGFDPGGLLVPELKLDGSTKSFYAAYGQLVSTYRRRLPIESFERLMPEIGERTADIIRLTAGLQGKTTDLSDTEKPTNIFGTRLVLDLKDGGQIRDLVYPKLVVFDEEDVTWAEKTGMLGYARYIRPKLEALLSQKKVVVVDSNNYNDSRPLEGRLGLVK